MASDPLEDLEKLKADPYAFDLIITDMTMPQIIVDQPAREALTMHSDIKIILCTGYSDVIDENKALDISVHAFMMKSINWDKLLRTIRLLLDQ